jgi:hypothetical protein
MSPDRAAILAEGKESRRERTERYVGLPGSRGQVVQATIRIRSYAAGAT